MQLRLRKVTEENFDEFYEVQDPVGDKFFDCKKGDVLSRKKTGMLQVYTSHNSYLSYHAGNIRLSSQRRAIQVCDEFIERFHYYRIEHEN